MMRSARDWSWSSYCATADQQEPLPFLTTDWILAQFGDERQRATDLYRKFVKQGRGVEVWDELRGGVLMGSDGFVEGISTAPAELCTAKGDPATRATCIETIP